MIDMVIWRNQSGFKGNIELIRAEILLLSERHLLQIND